MGAGDILASGGRKASYMMPAVSQEKWDAIFNEGSSDPRYDSRLAAPDKPPVSVENHGSVQPPNNRVTHGRRGRRAKVSHNGGRDSKRED